MRQLLPSARDAVDAYDAYRPDDPRAPLVRVNMVTSVDGHVTDADGLSGGLGGDGDSQAFSAMRHLCDAVVAGAGTVRAEGYGPMRVREGWGARRRRDGREDPAPIVVVTASVDLDVGSPLFTEAVAPTIVLAPEDAPADRVAGVRDAGGVVVGAGSGRVDLPLGLARLRDEHGLAHLLVEGGPSLNADLLAAGLVDELCITLAPTLAGGTDPRRVVDGLGVPLPLRLSRLLEHDGELLATYVPAA
ncbi:dihydrofolate reductase family protein [Euzebya sp.]|uniref:dihydrofolate reductase family protein n=1 Tax=Euzebya sp. TaxID=1971409 RepID=UPI0035194A00